MNMTNLTKGIDVSRWQGTNIKWDQVKSDGYLFTFIKVTDGSAYKKQFIDMAKIQANAALKAGLKIGYYHYAHPTNHGGLQQDAQEEAQFFLQTVKGFPKPSFPLVLDLEDPKMTLTDDETMAWVIAFQAEIKKAGYELILYSSSGFLNAHLPKNHTLGTIPLWLAQYPKLVDFNKPPKNPVGWTTWVAWQYSQEGKVHGFPNIHVDLNVMTNAFFSTH